MIFLEVAVALPIDGSLSYLAAADAAPVPGTRVVVPLGRRRVTGYVLAAGAVPVPGSPPVEKIRFIVGADDRPLFPANMVPFFRWMADYYQYPLGMVIRTAMPAGLAPESGGSLELSAAGRARFAAAPETAAGPVAAAMRELLQQGRLAAASKKKMQACAAGRRALASWEKEGSVVFAAGLVRDRVRPQRQVCVRLHLGKEGDACQEGLKKSEKKTLEILVSLTTKSSEPLVPKKDLAAAYGGASRALAGLEARGLVSLETRELLRDPFAHIAALSEAGADFSFDLSGDQRQALGALCAALDSGVFAAFLLHGVTGSGKTEVYLRAAAHCLAQNRSVLVLVPEIALSAQLERQFIARFGDKVAVLHSGLAAGERFDQWRRLAAGEALVVVGARSALFAPLACPGLLVVDEEHDSAYKQEDGLRYHARDMAVLRARFAGAVVLLGSATPAISSFYNVRKGKYTYLGLPRRVKDQPLPQVEIVDLRAIPTVTGRPPIFSHRLVSAMKETIAAGDQVLVLLNRRGFSQMLVCRSCGETICCKNCQVSLTLHKGGGGLVCHYCGFKIDSKSLCPACGGGEFFGVGFGTQRVEEELGQVLPAARIARLDRDVAQDRGQLYEILDAVRQGQVDVLLGTQMIAKGHHFPGITLVAVVLADTGLGLPDFRAAERTFQLLSQVTGRAGRGERPGRVIIQTFRPDHYSVTCAQGHDYEEFYAREIALRTELGFPPLSRMVNFLVSGRREEDVRQAATRLAAIAADMLRQAGPGRSLRLLGPAPAPLARLRDRYRWQLVLCARDVRLLQGLVRNLAGAAAAIKGAAVEVSVDVDPENML